jgi:crotonobetainyl-CoA:carnitine CoA-transferase CaiB-like acyl-CoA transferase
LANREAIEAELVCWLQERTASEAMETLQQAGIPAGRMKRVSDLPEFAAYRERQTFRMETHPYLPDPFVSEALIAKSERLAPPPTRAAPLAGEHSAEVMEEWLGMASAEIDTLVQHGVIEPLSAEIETAIRELKGRSHE